MTLPDRALGDIQVSAEYVVYAIERIHAMTHRKLTVITHSQGGMEGRWAMRWWTAARDDTAELIDLASPNHGIYAADACVDSGNCWPAVWQMASGSHFLKALNSVSETPGADRLHADLLADRRARRAVHHGRRYRAARTRRASRSSRSAPAASSTTRAS